MFADRLNSMMRFMRVLPVASAVILLFYSIFSAEALGTAEFPEYRVVLDPGHGGRAMEDRSLHWDRYDSISGGYLQVFKEGAASGGVEEHAVVYEIARKTMDILADCAPGGDFSRFSGVLARFSDAEVDRVYIKAWISRGDSRNEDEIRSRPDPNAEFRIFDFPALRKSVSPGRLSRINDLRPHLVVSLHAAKFGPAYYRGMNPVILAPYHVLYRGLLHLKGVSNEREWFYGSHYRQWFEESDERSSFDWFRNDAALYFLGYPLHKNGTVDESGFKGYRYNMVTWSYSDLRGWENEARLHPDHTQYARSPKTFVPKGKFWEREQSVYENYRRDGGPEGFGGDNHYASAELIRYILTSLEMNGLRHPDQKPGKPYISIWHMPLCVNAINAFMELGYLGRPWYRRLLTRHQDEIAQGLAVGIYSLLAGLPPRRGNFLYPPRGKSIDFKKYTVTNSKNYFDMVVPE